MENEEKGQEQEKRGFVLLNPLWSIRQRVSLVLAIGIIGSLFVGGYALVAMKPRYSAEGLVNFNPYLPKILYKSEDSDYIHSFEDWVRTQVNIIKSHPVMERAIQECEQQGFRWVLPNESLQSAADRLTARLKIVQIRDTQTISVSLVSSTKNGLPELINAIIKGYIQDTRDKSQEENTTKLIALKKEREKIQQDLATGYNDLEAISRKYGAGVTDEKYLYMYMDKLNDLKRSYNKAFLDEATARNRIAAFGGPAGKPKGRERPETRKSQAAAVSPGSPAEGNGSGGVRAGGGTKDAAPRQAEVRSVRHLGGKGPDTVRIELTAPAKITTGRLSNPKKFFVHIKNATLSPSLEKDIVVGDGLVKTVSAIQYHRDKVRILFEMETGDYSYETILSGNKTALTVRLSHTREGESHSAEAAAQGPRRHGADGREVNSLAIFNDPELTRLDLSLRDQMVGLAEDHPKYLYLKEKLRLLYDQAKAAYVARMNMDYSTATNTKETLAREVERVQNEVVDYNTAVIRVTSKKQEIERLQATLGRINERIDQITVESATPGRIIVQAWAMPPESPTVDRRGRILLIGIVGSFVLGGLISVVIDLGKNSVQRTMDLERFLGFPLTGFAIDSVHDGVEPRNIYTVYRDNPGSFVFDRYVSMGLKFERERADHGSRLFTFLSVGEGNGATSAALNILASLDTPKDRKLYIDLNTRSPLRNRLPELEKEPGVTDWLQGSGHIEDFIKDYEELPCRLIQTGMVKNPLPVVMNLTRFKDGVDSLGDRYDYIFIDVPPLLVSTDTQGMVRISDVVVVVVEANKTTWPALKKTMAFLDKTGIGVVAVMLNRVRILKSGRLKEQIETFYRRRDGSRG